MVLQKKMMGRKKVKVPSSVINNVIENRLREMVREEMNITEDSMSPSFRRMWNALDNVIQHSWVVGFDYYKYTKTSWLHAWGSLMPLHYSDSKNEFSYYNFNGGQWKDYSFGLIYGHWFNKNIGIFVEGKYNKYWNREWHNFSFGVNYKIF